MSEETDRAGFVAGVWARIADDGCSIFATVVGF
jgi:hypothetical protein